MARFTIIKAFSNYSGGIIKNSKFQGFISILDFHVSLLKRGVLNATQASGSML